MINCILLLNGANANVAKLCSEFWTKKSIKSE